MLLATTLGGDRCGSAPTMCSSCLIFLFYLVCQRLSTVVMVVGVTQDDMRKRERDITLLSAYTVQILALAFFLLYLDRYS